MKLVKLYARGGPEQLRYEEGPEPVPGLGEALVRVMATSITPNELSWTQTYFNEQGEERIPSIPSHAFSGIVESIPDGTNHVSAGDAVYGLTPLYRDGAAAEYVAVSASSLARKPLSIDHVQTAALPLSALAAMQGLFDHGDLTARKRVLILGGTGGVGIFAIQLARWCSAHVIATASRENMDFVKEQGAHEVVNYETTSISDAVDNVDIVFDTVGGHLQDAVWPVIKKDGVLITIAGKYSLDLSLRYGVQGKFFMVKPDHIRLNVIASLVDRGVIRPIIENVYPLQDIRLAFEAGLQKHNRGKIVLKVG